MLPKKEWAEKELIKARDKELTKMRARSVEMERALVEEGQSPSGLDEGIFYISGLSSGALAHLLRIGHLKPEDVRWDVIAGVPKGVKRLCRQMDMPASGKLMSDAEASAKRSVPESPLGRPEQYDWDEGFQFMRAELDKRGDPRNPINAVKGWRSAADVARLVAAHIAIGDQQPDFKHTARVIRLELQKWRAEQAERN
jgi:hypothetical protein